MKIRCISNSGKDVPSDCLPSKWGFNKDTDFNLTVDKIYTVFGFTVLLGYVWYYIVDDCKLPYPVWKPSPLFLVVDCRLSAYWEFGLLSSPSVDQTSVLVSFPEWVRDRLFYDRLTDGVEEDVKVFAHYRKLIELESDVIPAN